MAGALAHVIALSGGRWPEAWMWARLARALTLRTAPHGSSHFEALFDSGQVEYRAGRFAEAKDWFARALEHAEEHLDPHGLLTLGALAMIATLLGELGEYDAALAHFERLASLPTQVFGPSHPSIAELTNLGNLHLLRLELDEGERQYTRALAIGERIVGADHPLVALPLLGLGDAAALRGDVAAQRRDVARALRIEESSLGPDHPDIAWTLRTLAEADLHDGALDDVERLLARADALDARVGEDAERELASLAARGRLALARGDAEAACDLLARSLRGREHRAFDLISADRSSELARALVAAGRSDEARPAGGAGRRVLPPGRSSAGLAGRGARGAAAGTARAEV